MKNPFKYKKYYERWNELKKEIILDIICLLQHFELTSLDLTHAESHCVIHEFGLGQAQIAMGLVKTDQDRLMVHYGQYEPEDSMDVEHLNTHCLLRLYKVVEEALYEYQPEEFEL